MHPLECGGLKSYGYFSLKVQLKQQQWLYAHHLYEILRAKLIKLLQVYFPLFHKNGVK